MRVPFVCSGNNKSFRIIPFIKDQGESLKSQGIEVDYFLIVGKGFYGYLKAVLKLQEVLRQKHYDLIHAHYTLSGWVELSSQDDRIHFKGRINDVEALVNVCTIGVLFSVDGEGFSNAIMEYTALGKPVIANNAGGTKELVRHNENGYLFIKQSEEEIVSLII